MDNCTGTTCEQCHAIILYDKDAPKPKLCPVCKMFERREAEENEQDEFEDWADK